MSRFERYQRWERNACETLYTVNRFGYQKVSRAYQNHNGIRSSHFDQKIRISSVDKDNCQ